MAIGGYTTAILVADHGRPELATIPLAGLVAGGAGLLFGIPATAALGSLPRARHVRDRDRDAGAAQGVLGLHRRCRRQDAAAPRQRLALLRGLDRRADPARARLAPAQREARARLPGAARLGGRGRFLRDRPLGPQDGRVRRLRGSTPASPGRCSRSRSRSSTRTPTRSSSRSSSSSAPSPRASARCGASPSAPR